MKGSGSEYLGSLFLLLSQENETLVSQASDKVAQSPEPRGHKYISSFAKSNLTYSDKNKS